MNHDKNPVLSPGGWLSIIAIFLYGVLGAASVSKIIPLGHEIHQLFNTSPADFGFLISLVGIPAALLALPSGVVVDRFGPRAVLITCALIGIVANLIYFVSDSFAAFQAARLIEGSVIVFCYTAGPAYLMATNDGTRRGTAMTVWSMYMPIGFTTGLFLGGLFAGTENWRTPYLVHACAYLVVALITLLQAKVSLAKPGQIPGLVQRLKDVGQAYVKPTILLLGLTFLIMIILGFGANSSFPSYFAKIHQIPLGQASNMVASVTLVMAFGSIVTGVMVSKGWRPQFLFIGFALIGMVLGSLSFYPDISLAQRPLVVAGWLFVSGGASACMMAMMPLVAEPHQRASAAALVNQAGAIASFIAPPVWLSVAASSNWLPFAYMMCAGLLLSVLMVAVIALRVKPA